MSLLAPYSCALRAHLVSLSQALIRAQRFTFKGDDFALASELQLLKTVLKARG